MKHISKYITLDPSVWVPEPKELNFMINNIQYGSNRQVRRSNLKQTKGKRKYGYK